MILPVAVSVTGLLISGLVGPCRRLSRHLIAMLSAFAMASYLDKSLGRAACDGGLRLIDGTTAEADPGHEAV